MQKKAALVLSGGSFLGLAHIGVVQELEKAGYVFDAVYGVSAGSMVGACVAAGIPGDKIEQIFMDLDLKKLTHDFSDKASGVIKGEKIRLFFNTLLESKTFSDLETPLSLGATDFNTGSAVAITTGLVADAVRASISLPLIFEPFPHPETNSYLVDGALTDNFPLARACEQYSGETIIAIDVHDITPLPDEFYSKRVWGIHVNIPRYLDQTLDIMINSQQNEIADPRVTIIKPKLDGFTIFSLQKKHYSSIIQSGRDAIQDFINSRKE